MSDEINHFIVFESLDELKKKWTNERSPQALTALCNSNKKLTEWLACVKKKQCRQNIADDIKNIEKVLGAFKNLCNARTTWPKNLDGLINRILDEKKPPKQIISLGSVFKRNKGHSVVKLTFSDQMANQETFSHDGHSP